MTIKKIAEISSMLEIKISTQFPDWPLIRQTPLSKGIWGQSRFHIDNPDISECDYWVVYEGLLQKETVACPRDHTILITGEPPCMKHYSRKFLDQFHTIITCHTDISGPYVIHSQQGLPWHIGRKSFDGVEKGFGTDYDYYKQRIHHKKEKLLSVISSKKTTISGHRNRLRFVNMLSDHFGNDIDIFGRGIHETEDKAEAIEPYKYHIAIENCACPDYFSEKLTDTYLGGAFPLYFGCTNLDRYFPDGSFIYIDITRPEDAIKKIEHAISGNTYELSGAKIEHAKNLTLDTYNVFPAINTVISRKQEKTVGNKESVTLYPEMSFRISRFVPSPCRNLFYKLRSCAK